MSNNGNITNVKVENTSNIYGGNRSGFFHESAYNVVWNEDGQPKSKDFRYRVQYYNRTWEAHPFDTSKRNALYTAKQWREDILKKGFLQENGLKRLSQKRKPIFERMRDADPIYKAMEETYRKI